MPRNDWLVGRDRGTEATERIYSAASELVSRQGFENFTIDALAAEVHCSAATIYRHTGGKAAILEAVILRFSTRVITAVHAAIAPLSGTERIVQAIVVGLERIRAERLGSLMMVLVTPDHDGDWVTASSKVAAVAEEIIGRDDPIAAQWLIRITLALWCWPLKDSAAELALIRRFVAGASFANHEMG